MEVLRISLERCGRASGNGRVGSWCFYSRWDGGSIHLVGPSGVLELAHTGSHRSLLNIREFYESIGSLKLPTVGNVYTTDIGKSYKSELPHDPPPPLSFSSPPMLAVKYLPAHHWMDSTRLEALRMLPDYLSYMSNWPCSLLQWRKECFWYSKI